MAYDTLNVRASDLVHPNPLHPFTNHLCVTPFGSVVVLTLPTSAPKFA